MKEEGQGDGARRETFLSRWSRLKLQAKEQPVPAPVPSRPAEKADSPPPELPPLQNLTLESDYRGFFHPKVDENLRRAALRRLFSDPHFNVMDGLDVYIEDYSKSDPLPAALLAQLRQAQRILEWAKEKPEDAKPQGATEQVIAAGRDKRIAPVTPDLAADQSSVTATAPESAGNRPAESNVPRITE